MLASLMRQWHVAACVADNKTAASCLQVGRAHPAAVRAQTRPFCALEMICRTAEPTTTKRKSARTTGPTVKGDFCFFEPLDTLPIFFSYCCDFRAVFREAGILADSGGRDGARGSGFRQAGVLL
mmetsp:Transcript_53378/g.171031  ORF Transcript_53378/g.171031 Transcript_53378/m.171031 type:complete len:124 (+) Transcript_53378:32-403(+)